MRDIRLDSRCKEVVTLYKSIDDDHGVLISNGNYVRLISDKDKTIKAIDFEGGPMLSVGGELPCTYGRKIKSIKAAYYVELE